jgi:hypothetical protein
MPYFLSQEIIDDQVVNFVLVSKSALKDYRKQGVATYFISVALNFQNLNINILIKVLGAIIV